MSLENINILIVDDMISMRHFLIKKLKEYGFKFFLEASNGSDAWDVLKTNTIDLVITDINMSELNGLELIENMRANKEFSKIPTIIVTCEHQNKFKKKSNELSFTRYLSKPVNILELKTFIEQLYLSKT